MSAIDSGTGLWLGLDTGGTFTDAVLFEDGRGVIASAKALTTPWNLATGIGKALVAVLDLLPAGSSRKDVTLVSVSTTLATNAIVENRFSPVCTLLIGLTWLLEARRTYQPPVYEQCDFIFGAEPEITNDDENALDPDVMAVGGIHESGWFSLRDGQKH